MIVPEIVIGWQDSTGKTFSPTIRPGLSLLTHKEIFLEEGFLDARIDVIPGKSFI
jgi:hypothetical protein